jgi:peptidoglycan hydrolase CwlO-like protein
MAMFYIEKLVVTGSGKTPSTVEFSDGLNFIVGPSNTGKSLVVDSIDYLFGFEPSKNEVFRFDPAFGYDIFTLHTRTPNGTVVFQRKYGEAKVNVFGTDPNFEHREYSARRTAKHSIGDVWLQMMGIDEPHKILQSQAGKTQQLSWRTFLHMFFIKQDYVTRMSSVLYNPKVVPNMASTPSKAAALFLMTGKDGREYDVNEDKKIRSAKKSAVIEYIKDTVGRFAKRESELIAARDDFANSYPSQTGYRAEDINVEVDAINSEIDALQNQININIGQSRSLMHDIYKGNGRLAECETVAERFAVLRSQYQSDIERLTFVIDGDLSHATLPKRERCPFCDSEMQARDGISHIDAARAELRHIRVHLTELEKAEQDIANEAAALQAQVKSLEGQKREIDALVSSELNPRLTALKERLSLFRYIIEIDKELDVIQSEERSFNSDLYDKENEEEPVEVKHDIDTFFDRETVQAFQSKLIAILQACHYRGAGSARLNMDAFDLEIGGREKAISNGGGYCGFLNTVVALALVEFLEEQGAYSPGLFIVDSPMTQLSESEYMEKQDTLVSGLLDYLLGIYAEDADADQTSAEQIIIIEHKDRMPTQLDELANKKHVKVAEFTRDKEHGRYGFLEGVYQYE